MEEEKNKMLAEICLMLSETCKTLSDKYEEEEIFSKEKLRILKKHYPKQFKVVKSLMGRKKKNYIKYRKEFTKKAIIFNDFSKLYRKEYKQ